MQDRSTLKVETAEQKQKSTALICALDLSLNPTWFTRLRAAFRTAFAHHKYSHVNENDLKTLGELERETNRNIQVTPPYRPFK